MGEEERPGGEKTFFWKGGENLNIQEIKLNTRIKEEIEVEEKQSISQNQHFSIIIMSCVCCLLTMQTTGTSFNEASFNALQRIIQRIPMAETK